MQTASTQRTRRRELCRNCFRAACRLGVTWKSTPSRRMVGGESGQLPQQYERAAYLRLVRSASWIRLQRMADSGSAAGWITSSLIPAAVWIGRYGYAGPLGGVEYAMERSSSSTSSRAKRVSI